MRYPQINSASSLGNWCIIMVNFIQIIRFILPFKFLFNVFVNGNHICVALRNFLNIDLVSSGSGYV